MVDEKFKVRMLEENDLSGWFRLRKQLWDELTEDEHKAEMMDIYEHFGSQLVLMVENDEKDLIGFLEASIRPFVEDCSTDQVGYVEGWYVEREFRRNGIGRKLVRAAESWARSKGCKEMASDAEIGNDLSLKAHLSLGYEETSRLVHLRKDLD